MKKKSLLLLVIVLFVVAVVMICMSFIATPASNRIKCRGEISVISQGKTINMNVLIMSDARNSTIFIRGFLADQGQKFNFNQVAHASVRSENNHLRLNITHSELSTETSTPESETLERYLINEIFSHNFFIYRMNNQHYVLTNGYIPSLYCSKSP